MKYAWILCGMIAAASETAQAGRYEQLKNQDSAWPINWQSRNGEIVYDSVCEDKGNGSVAYRNCRREAQKLFRDKCKAAKNRSTDKFCTASNRYYP